RDGHAQLHATRRPREALRGVVDRARGIRAGRARRQRRPLLPAHARDRVPRRGARARRDRLRATDPPRHRRALRRAPRPRARPLGREPRRLMPSRRAAITMSDPELHRFLQEERIVTIATIGPNGRPHLMPLWYVADGTVISAWTFGKSQKVKNLERR